MTLVLAMLKEFWLALPAVMYFKFLLYAFLRAT